ncbi:MAG: UDP-3-O-(3-hydroxymyristoyl)glucosamine N-acyltransferase [Acidobacteria bacterium]|nr:UDP-3-O-(3-hydroxymyristoyl)glucosamine N-acyltransferase [Acidobacteriota bacterium]
MKLKEIAEQVGCRLEDPEDGDIDVQRVAGIEQAQPGELTFIANAKYRPQLTRTKASAVIVGEAMSTAALPLGAGGTPAILRAADPYLAFARSLRLLTPATPPSPGIDPSAVIAPDAAIGSGVSIGPLVTIGAGASIGARTVIHPLVAIGPGAHVGDDCVVHAHVSIRERVRIGHRVVLQDGAVIGSDGFGFVKQADGTHLKIPQHADVVIEDDVEIGANTTIDRPAVGETRIGAGAKIDNLVQVAHGVSVGRRALFASQVGISGSTVVEDDVVLAGQVGVAGHIRIGKGVVATAQTGVPNSIEPGQFVSGYPAIANRDWLKASAVFRRLPLLKKRIAELERRIIELEEKLAACRPPSDR